VISVNPGHPLNALPTTYATGFGSGAPGAQPGSAAKKSSHRARCASLNVAHGNAACTVAAAALRFFASAAASQSLPAGQIRSARPHAAASGAPRYTSACSSRKASSRAPSRFSSVPNVARLKASMKSCRAVPPSVCANIRRSTRRRSSRAACSCNTSKSPASPSSSGKARTTRAKKLSSVPRLSRCIASVIPRSNFRKSAARSAGTPISAASFFATVSLSAAPASFLRISSKNSPAALRVNVSAAIRSGLAPSASRLT